MALASSNFKNVSGYELEALFTWSRQMEPVEVGLLPTGELRFCISKRLRTQWDIQLDPSNCSFAIATWKVMHSKSPMIGRSCSCWKNTVLTGESDSTTTSNPLCSSQVRHSLSCYVCNVIKSALELSYPDVLTGKKGECSTCSFRLTYDTSVTRRTLWISPFDLFPPFLDFVLCLFRGF